MREYTLTDYILREQSNSCFCKEACSVCRSTFNADDNFIWQLLTLKFKVFVGYVCYSCARKLIDEHKKSIKVIFT